jgi:hypothetical protein
MTEGESVVDDQPTADDQSESRPDVDLAEFLRILPHLEAADLMEISAAYQQADAEARERARAAASAVARKRRLMDQLGELQGSIIQWAGSDMPQSSVFTFLEVRPNQMLGDVRVQAVPPLLDAATALLLGDSLETSARDALLEPWSSAIS